MKKHVGILFIIVILFSSCRVLFTEQLRQKAENQKIDLTKIQFYNSDKIVLTRTLASSEVSLASGKVTFQNGIYTEIIKIKKNTRGKCDMVGSNILNISFEVGNNRSLVFENNFNNYQLKPTNCKKAKRTSTTYNANRKPGEPLTKDVVKEVDECTLNYEGKVYQVELPVMPKLLIKKRQINKNKTSVRTAKGVKVN
ncbi:MAG: hypothetical protein NT127_08085 [Sphingobacteriales bacterium]|nr:hypothetical protein [Sphingobacteriales bacterium]